jgi:hypothetical protein
MKRGLNISAILLLVAIPALAQFQRVIDDFRVDDPVGWDENTYPDIGCDRNGNFIVTWTKQVYEGSPTPDTVNVYYQRYDNLGNRIGGNVLLKKDVYHSTAVAMSPGGRFAIAWRDPHLGTTDVFVRVFDSTGTAVTGDVLVNDTTVPASQGMEPHGMAMDSLGNFVIAWFDNRNDIGDIYARRFDRDGVPIGIDFRVNDDVTSTLQEASSVSMAPDGRFVITWEDYREGGFYPDIYAQLYNRSGVSQGNSFRVNDDVADSNQGAAAASMDKNGNFVISWADRRSYKHVYGQRYDSLGNSLGNNFKVSVKDTAGGFGTSIACDGNGNFLICWAQGYYYKIIAQRYDSTGSVVDSNFIVAEDVASPTQVEPQVISCGGSDYLFTWRDIRNNKAGDYRIWANKWGIVNGVSSLEQDDRTTVENIKISYSYPNPFSDNTRIYYRVNRTGRVALKIYSIKGELVKTLVDNIEQAPGYYQIDWVGNDEKKRRLSSGLYLYRITVGCQNEVGKLVLAK